MPVTTIECQLTQAQVKRYISGADLPDDVLNALERHLKACPECMAEANRQREANGGAPVEVAQALIETEAKATLWSKALGKFAKTSGAKDEPALSLVPPKGEPLAKPGPLTLLKTPKNLLLSGSLAVVLIFMSAMSRNPSSLFGPRASASLAPQAPKAAETSDSAKPETSKDTTPPASSEHSSSEPATPSSDVHDVPKVKTKPTPSGGKEPVSRPPVSKTLPKIETKPKLGGPVVIADGDEPVPPPAKRASAKAHRNQTSTKGIRNRPKAHTVKPAKRAGSSARIRVYLPDGTLKRP